MVWLIESNFIEPIWTSVVAPKVKKNIDPCASFDTKCPLKIRTNSGMALRLFLKFGVKIQTKSEVENNDLSQTLKPKTALKNRSMGQHEIVTQTQIFVPKV